MKECTKCGEIKPPEDFVKRKDTKSGLTSHCKMCLSERARRYAKENRDRVLEKQRRHRAENSEEIRSYHKEWSNKNKDKIRSYYKKYYSENREKILASHKRHRQENPGLHCEYKKRRCMTDPSFKMIERLRTRVLQAIKMQYGDKAKSTTELLGCSVDDARAHLEARFKDGMSWGNHGDWHIDHIRPCASFDLTDPEQQKECFHYTNLQPLWAKENMKKNDTYEKRGGDKC